MTERKCPFCAEKVQAEAIKCKHCGAAIAPGTCVSCERKNRREALFCSYCGSDDLIGRPEVPNIAAPVRATPSPGIRVGAQREKDDSEMVLVPAGEFWMGSNVSWFWWWVYGQERSRHKVYVPAFYMDKYPVTVAQFQKFCRETGHDFPEQPPWSTDRHPVANVSWDDATAYCDWSSKRLPSEA